ncbi:MAG: hypothetical protein ACE5IQ_05655 [Candidatus Methylomirabilales bacterium]
MDVQALLEFLIREGSAWVQAQRDLYRPDGRPLTTQEKQNFGSFFEIEALDSARVRKVPVIHNPDFYGQLAQLGVHIPLDFSEMAGITFADTILISVGRTPPGAPLDSLLFHELVHVVQYETLGVPQFVHRYVHGWAQNGFRYDRIPLERDAYELQGSYESQPQRAFSVMAEVRRRLGVL